MFEYASMVFSHVFLSNPRIKHVLVEMGSCMINPACSWGIDRHLPPKVNTDPSFQAADIMPPADGDV